MALQKTDYDEYNTGKRSEVCQSSSRDKEEIDEGKGYLYPQTIPREKRCKK